MTKTIGIVGGMGPLATADLFTKIIHRTKAAKDQDHIHVLIDSNPAVPDRTAAILHGGEDPTPILLQSCKNLEAMGAEVVGVACIADRRAADCDFALPVYSAVKLNIANYAAEDCPLCKEGKLELVKPGSRKKV